jgi:outer membrane protein TolC
MAPAVLLATVATFASGVRGEEASVRRLDLRSAAELAVARPPAVRAALLRVASAQASYAVARGAYWPSLRAQAEAAALQQTQRYFVPNSPNQKADAKGSREALDARVEWLVSDFRGRASEVERTDLEREAFEHDAQLAKFSALRASCELYVRVLTTERLRQNAQLSVERRDAISQAISRLIDAGLRPRVDLSRAEIEAVAARAEVSVLSAQAQVERARLLAALGLDPGLRVVLEEYADSVLRGAGDETQAVREALAARPELPAASARVAARSAAVGVARARRFPSLGLFGAGNYQFNDIFQGSGIDGSSFAASAGVFLRWNVLDVSAWRSMRVARAQLEVERVLLDEQSLAVRTEAIVARRDVERAEAALAQAVDVLAAAATTRDAQHRRYQVGEASLLELLDAEALEQEARSRRILAQRELELSRIALLDATGSLAERLQ